MTLTREGIFQLEFAVLVIYGIIMLFKRVKLNKFLFNLAFGLYLALVIAVCFFPVKISGNFGEGAANNFIPFKSILAALKETVSERTPYGLISLFGNFAMLMPLGIFFHYYIKAPKRRPAGIFLFSIGIETVQLIIGLLIGYNYRCIDIDDVILNTCGGILACALFDFVMKKYAKKHNKSPQSQDI